MSLARNKRGIEFMALVEIILIVIATGLIMGGIGLAAQRSDEKTAENLCRGFNALRYGTSFEVPLLPGVKKDVELAPRACRTIDKKDDLPSSRYKSHVGGAKGGAMAEVRDLMTRCWWMWLEGHEQNMFDKSWYNLQNGCFVCYTFSIDKKAGSFSYDEFTASLNKPYYALDTSNRCAPAGQGGKCMTKCNKFSDEFSREIESNRCEKGLKCCIAAELKDGCKNKGGRCLSEPLGEYTYLYDSDRWQCSIGRCYVKRQNVASYRNYIEGTGGVSGGAGKVLFAGDEGFKSGLKYAITFVSPGKSFDLSTGIGLFTTGAGITATITSIVMTGGLSIPIYIIAGITGYEILTTANSGSIEDTNYILISTYDVVKNTCAIEAGVGER